MKSFGRVRLLVATLGSPLAWVLHLNGSYLIVAAWCSSGMTGMSLVLGVWTLLCAAIAVVSGVVAVRLWRYGQEQLRHDAEPGTGGTWDARFGERGARFAFLAVVSIGAAAMFTWLIVLQGLPPIFTPGCWAGTGP